MKALVTGGAGFIGSHLVDALVKKNFEVIVLDNLFTGKKEYVNKKAKFVKADIRNFNRINKYFKNVDYVFHLAAQARIQPSIANPLDSNEANVNGTLNVLLVSRDARVKKVIFSGSSSVYGDQKKLPLKEDMIPRPKNPYALQKLFGEYYCKLFSRLYKLPTVTLRYFNVYGPRQPVDGAYATVIGIFLKQKKEGKELTIVPDGKQRRDFTHVYDVVNANILAAESERVSSGEVINIGTGQNYSVLDIADLVGGKNYPRRFIEARLGEARETLADISLAKKLLNWEPKIRFEDGLKMY